MIDFVLVENVLVCAVLVLFVMGMAFAVVYLGAIVGYHMCDVRRIVEHLRRK
ncbi:hypothetical protein [Methanomethylophilus alvi]|uniref:hypothetical protein n=1 Tax=Methanomethylophilus alvi TaxID=1291540 RepID=UPI0037DD47FB